MTTFQHKTLPVIISYSEWSKLSSSEQSNFTICNSISQQVTNISTTNVSSETSDLLGLGKVAETAACVAVLPVAIVGSLLGFFD